MGGRSGRGGPKRESTERAREAGGSESMSRGGPTVKSNFSMLQGISRNLCDVNICKTDMHEQLLHPRAAIHPKRWTAGALWYSPHSNVNPRLRTHGHNVRSYSQLLFNFSFVVILEPKFAAGLNAKTTKTTLS